ncbi:MAG: acyltransferase [Verrucomicrobia bacterium]|nr:acyltransferase [Verrucomicrobiota bacterium]
MCEPIIQRFLRWCNDFYDRVWWYAHRNRFACRGEGCVVEPGDLTFENIHLGSRVHVAYGCVIWGVRGHIFIGDRSGIASQCVIRGGNHNTECRGRFMMDLTEAEKRPQDDKGVVIEEDVWIGMRSVLLSGARVGRGAVVGAGSVIRGRVPPYAIVLGNPARVVSFRAPVPEILAHEAKLYPPEKRLKAEALQAEQRRYPSKYLFC